MISAEMTVTSSLSMLLLLLCLALPRGYAWKNRELCEACEDAAKAFKEGLKRTRIANFGGGNTAWEESRLGNYAFSETRLVGIMEGLCTDSSRQKNACHQMVEEHEELIEEWWRKKFRADPNKADLFNFLCINRLKVCCAPRRYGPQCLPCPAIVTVTADKDGKTEKKVCNGHGTCDGAGLRSGNGTCSCDHGYEGEQCSMCSDDHFNANTNGNATGANSSAVTCEPCHSACAGGCNGPEPSNCTAGCGAGWTWLPGDGDEAGGGCVDVDECANKTSPVCGDGEHCENSPGSHQCLSCHEACSKCAGPGPANCSQCAEGYRFVDPPPSEGDVGHCQDVDECAEAAADSPACSGGKVCTNTPGSFTCECPAGQEENDEGVCAKSPAKDEDSEKPKSDEAEASTTDAKKEESPTKHEEL